MLKHNSIFKLILGIGVLFLASCKKDAVVVVLPTFDDVVKQQSLNMFNTAVEKANLQDFKNGGGPYTWFAPTDAAFIAAGITTDSLNKITPSALSYLMTYHLINARYVSTDMIAISSISRTTQMGTAIFNGLYKGKYYVNGGKIATEDILVKNGVIHVSEAFLTPPQLRGNIGAILNSTGRHTLFIAALTRAGLLAQFSTATVFTVLAPTDAAMTAAGYTMANIATTPTTTLADFCRYQYFNNVRLFTNDFAATSSFATALGSNKYVVTSADGTKVKGVSNLTPVNITVFNRLGTNGVVHEIDAVLRP